MKKEEKAPVYILCPRCELNYIGKKDKLCNVCKAEIGLIDPSILIPDDEVAGDKLCPICNVNYIAEDEDVCFLCVKEREDKTARGGVKWGFEEPEDDIDIVDEVVADIVVADEDELPFGEEIPFDEEIAFEEEELDEELIDDDLDFEELDEDEIDFEDYDEDEDEDLDDEEDDDDF